MKILERKSYVAIVIACCLFAACSESELAEPVIESSIDEYEIVEKSFIHLNTSYNVSFKEYKDTERNSEPIEGPDNDYVKAILEMPNSGIVVAKDGVTQILHRTEDEFNTIMKEEFNFTQAQLDKMSEHNESEEKDGLKSAAIKGRIGYHKHDQIGGCPKFFNSSSAKYHYLNTGFTNPSSSSLGSLNDEISEVLIWYYGWSGNNQSASCGETVTWRLFEHTNFGGKTITRTFIGDIYCPSGVQLCSGNEWNLSAYSMTWLKNWSDEASSIKTFYNP